LWILDEEGIQLRAVIHDRDKKFAAQADTVFKSEGVRVILTPLLAPRANAHAERTTGPDGALWFTEMGAGKIGRITVSGTFTEFSLPATASSPEGITAGPITRYSTGSAPVCTSF
jgi:hypothetical protein